MEPYAARRGAALGRRDAGASAGREGETTASDSLAARLTRRRLLGRIGSALSAAAVTPLVAACGGANLAPTPGPTTPPRATAIPTAPPATPTATATATARPMPAAGATPTPRPRLAFWWWGEQEAPGLGAWVRESAALFEHASGAQVAPMLVDTEHLVSQFQGAAAAHAAPDVQSFWSGIYQMESVWLGYVAPLDGLISGDLIRDCPASALSVYGGRPYRLGWYAAPMLWVYNRELFDAAGLDPDKPPMTHDALLQACERLKRKEITPIVGGLQDGYWAEWHLAHALGANLDAPAELVELLLGARDWREPRYWDHWAKLGQLGSAGFLNDDMLATDALTGVDLFSAGQGAMASLPGPLLRRVQRQLGAERVWPMLFPASGAGRMNSRPVVDVQGLGIATESTQPRRAASFLSFLHTPERVAALYDRSGQLPADRSWDGRAIADPALRYVWERWVRGDSVPYLAGLLPPPFWSEGVVRVAQRVVAGEIGAQEAAEQAATAARAWREQQPRLRERYARWASDLAL